MPTPEGHNKEIFLSYASEDAEAAKRICEALRQAGVEVWFDQSELRGGEAWDRSIRRQIRDCALFVPLVSANTQARPEGYFRLEWHLAEQRSLLIAKGRPFIVPVSIDTTTERDALVPDAFFAVQWMRLPGGETPPAFGEQMKRLLSGEAARDRRNLVSGLTAGSGNPLSSNDGPPQIPDYDLIRLIGQGSYGDVWLARGVTGIYRAIKVVWRSRFKDAQPYEREFRGLKDFAAISLGESVQMALLHVGRNDAAGFFYYVMELADDVDRGRDIDPARYVPLTLTEVRARNGRVRVPAKDCLMYGVELARVLAGLHRRGLIHRDIKPSNVILVNGVPKLADIGLVTSVDATMTYVGTEGFVPPEGPGSASADVFALGRLLYELATGLDRQEFPQLPPGLGKLSDYRLLLELNEIILRACDPVAANRYRDGTALLADLSALHAGSSVRRRRIGAGVLRAALISATVLVVAAVAWWQWRPAVLAPPATPVSTRPQVDSKSVAVLAFANLSADKEQEYFSDGVSEELLNVLAKIPGLKVTARTSSFHFKGKDTSIAEIARQLGVAYIVEGSVRKSGDKIRITAQLIKAADGFHVWSEKFDRDPKDIFAVQDEIAQIIVTQVRGLLTGGAERATIAAQVRAASKGGTKNAAAHELFLQGKHSANQFSLENHVKAAEFYQRAIALDPAYALAFAALARTHIFQAGNAVTLNTMTEQYKLADQFLDRALVLEPDLAEGLGARAEMLFYGKFDWRGADKALRQALALAPADPTLLAFAAQVWGSFGQIDQATALARKAMLLDPLNVQNLLSLSGLYAVQGRFKDAEALKRRVMELSPEAPFAFAALALDYLYQGRFDEAADLVKKEQTDYARLSVLTLARWGQRKVPESDQAFEQLKALGDNLACAIAQIYTYRQDFDQAFVWLERARQSRDTGLISIRFDPLMSNLGADPRWPVFLRKLGLHDDQLAEFLPDMQNPAFVPFAPVGPPPPSAAQSPAPPTSPSAQPTLEQKSIAVLPFLNRSTDKDNEFFTEGVHEDILTNLCNIRALRVVSRTSVRQYRDTTKSLKEIGAELGVDYILEGSVQRVGQKVRVTGQLIDARTDAHLWAKAFDKDASDIFVIQAEIATAIAAELQTVLSPQEQQRIVRPPTRNAEAYELYLKAGPMSLMTGTANSEAMDLLNKAIALDPQFALAYSALARRYLFQGYQTGRDDFTRSLETARTAVALDPQLARAHYVLANSLGVLGRPDEARLAFQRSIELDSSFQAALNDLSVLETMAGRMDQAFYWAKRGFVLGPNLGVSYYHVAVPLMVLDLAQAKRWLQAGVRRLPAKDRTGGHRLEIMLANIELIEGQPAAALERMRKLTADRPTNRECQAALTEMALFAGAADAGERIDQALKEGPGARTSYSGHTPRTMRAFLWVKSGDREKALPLIDAALAENRAAVEAGDRNYISAYENIALYQMRGDRTAALDALETAYNLGLRDAAYLKADPLLAPLANEPRFLQVVERINRDLREMSARVDLTGLDELAGGRTVAVRK